MKTVTEQKVKLEQKKNRLAAEETRLNLKERKMRTRHLIEIGGLVVKAELDHLPTNTLYGALLSLKNTLAENDAILKQWSNSGKTVLDKDEKSKVARRFPLHRLVERRNDPVLSRIKVPSTLYARTIANGPFLPICR